MTSIMCVNHIKNGKVLDTHLYLLNIDTTCPVSPRKSLNHSFSPSLLPSHDWPTAECIKILTNIRKSMSPSSRLLIRKKDIRSPCITSLNSFLLDEFVLQNAVRDPSVPNQVSLDDEQRYLGLFLTYSDTRRQNLFLRITEWDVFGCTNRI